MIEPRLPTVAEFRELADAVGWLDHYDWPSVGDALRASVFAVVALGGGRVMGTARLVGDGAKYFYVQDVMVHPDFTDEGVASRLVQALLDWVGSNAVAEASVGLFSSPDARGVYESLGFDTPKDMMGMHRIVKPTR